MLDYAFLYALEGTPYAPAPEEWFNRESPVWTSDMPLLPPMVIQAQACTDAGLGNLARRSAGLSAIGRMSSWWGAYALLGETYDPYFAYPMGTLFMRAYTGPTDPGHMGILTPRGILHATPDQGVVLEPEIDHSWTVAVHPLYWLTRAS